MEHEQGLNNPFRSFAAMFGEGHGGCNGARRGVNEREAPKGKHERDAGQE